jgi:hypothetical protein
MPNGSISATVVECDSSPHRVLCRDLPPGAGANIHHYEVAESSGFRKNR